MSNQFNLIVVNDSALARGGATALAIESALGAAREGWNVTFFSRTNKTPDPRLAKNGVHIRGVNGEKVSGQFPAKAFISGIWNSAAKQQLADLVSEHDMTRTIIHVHNWAHFLSPSIFDVLGEHQESVVMSTHDFFLTCGNGGQFNYQSRTPCTLVGNSPQCLSTRCDKRNSIQKMWRVARHKTRKRTLPSESFSGTVALVHNKQKPFFERAGFNPDRIVEIRNPITPLTNSRVKAEDNKSILFIGRLDVEKGADVAAQAAELAGAKIVFAGEGPLKSSIQKTYSNAEIMGFCDRSKLKDLIGEARLLIMPSWLETFGLAAVEALWSGVPVLMSKNALLSDDIVARDAGVSIDPGNVQSMSTIIKSMMEDDAQIKRLSENAFHRSADIANTPDSWTNAHTKIYESILTTNFETPELPAQKVALLNVHYSANLGDGLLSDCLGYGLEKSASQLHCFPVDLAGRESITTLGGSMRGTVLNMLARLPGPLRRAAITPMQKYFLTRSWRPHYKNKLESADCVVLGGGNLIVDQDLNFPVKIHAALAEATRNDLPVHIYGVGVGAVFSKKALSLFKKAFSDCDLQSVSVRDEASRQSWEKHFAASCGIPAEIVYDPGVIAAHRWPRPACPKKLIKPVDCAIGIMSPNELNYHNNSHKFTSLKSWYLQLIEDIQGQGHNVVLFSNGSPEDTKFISSHLLPHLENVQVFIPESHVELCSLLGQAHLTIAFRLHAVIPATSYGNHVIALEWDKKIRSFMTRIGKSDQCFNVRETDASIVAALGHALMAKPLESPSYAGEAERQIRKLASRINSLQPNDGHPS